jgi:Zn-dependent protease with chaperone function
MATDFFQRQDSARSHTTLLLVYFGMALLALTGLIYFLFAFVLLLGTDPSEGAGTLWNPALLAAVAAGVLVVISGASLMKFAQLASGGKAVALMLNGHEVPGDTDDLRLRRLLNVVEEMAIASGVPVPAVFVLPHETAINAFAAGHAPGDAVVAVSEGCLTYLTRDELQGVVAHEFSHILNGDMRLNLRLTGLIFGILAISQIGWFLMQSGRFRRSSSRDDNRGGQMLLGLGLYLLGLASAFFGWLIQAAVSRQREYLADASAVQFTRNPEGIGGALKKIGGLKEGSRIGDEHAGEIGHMFQADAFAGSRLTNLFATHPPLGDRIRRLDPHFDGRYPAVQPVGVSAEERKGPQKGRIPPILPGLPNFVPLALSAAAGSASSHVGDVEPVHVSYAAALQRTFPEQLQDAAQCAFTARSVIYCLLLDTRPAIRAAQLARLREEAAPRDYEQTLRLVDLVSALPDEARLALADLTLPALRQMSPKQHQVFRTQVDALIHADQKVSLFEYALHCVLAGHLDTAFCNKQPQVRYRSAAVLVPQVTTVLSLLAWEGAAPETNAQAAFAAGMQSFLGKVDPSQRLLPRDQCSLREFDAALQKLAEALPAIKRRVVDACAACILSDQQVTVRERELLRAISAKLGCPLPPLIDEPGQ